MAVQTKAVAYQIRANVVERFKLTSRLAHWGHALSFLVLLTTGLGLVFRGVVGVTALRSFGLIHRGAAWPFTFIAVALLLFGARRELAAWLRSVTQFDRDDRGFLARFALEFFGRKVDLPPQGRFNGGEKINSLIQIVGWVVMVSTGWLLVYKDRLPGVAQWALPLHSFTAMLLGAAVLGHLYLSLGHPHTRVGLSGMITGWVDRKWAKGHHEKWYNEIQG